MSNGGRELGVFGVFGAVGVITEPAVDDPGELSFQAAHGLPGTLPLVDLAAIEGVSTRRVDDLVRSLGCEGISKSQVSRICAELDGVVASFLERPLDGGPYRYLWLDALTQRVREEGRIAQVSVVVATAVNADGKREVLGIDVGTSEDGAVWLSFLRGLVARGLSGVELVTSDAHQGLKAAIATVFGGASWQRCRTHFMRNLLTRVPKSAEALVATTVRTIFQQPSAEAVHAQHARVVEQLDERFPAAAAMLDEAAPEVLAFTALPGRALEAGLVEQPAGTPQSRDPPAHRRGRHLPQPRRGRAARRRGARRAARRVGRREALHDDGDPAASAGARGHFNRGGAAAGCQLANDQDGVHLHHLADVTVGVITEPAVDDPGELSFQAAHGLPGTLPLVDLAAIVVVPGAWVHALHVGHQVQRGVEFPVARTRQPVSDGISAGYLDRGCAGVAGEGVGVANRPMGPVCPRILAART